MTEYLAAKRDENLADQKRRELITACVAWVDSPKQNLPNQVILKAATLPGEERKWLLQTLFAQAEALRDQFETKQVTEMTKKDFQKEQRLLVKAGRYEKLEQAISVYLLTLNRLGIDPDAKMFNSTITENKHVDAGYEAAAQE